MLQKDSSWKHVPRNIRMAKVVQVIETEELVGNGTEQDPCYLEHLYWTLDGKLLAIGTDSP